MQKLNASLTPASAGCPRLMRSAAGVMPSATLDTPASSLARF